VQYHTPKKQYIKAIRVGIHPFSIIVFNKESQKFLVGILTAELLGLLHESPAVIDTFSPMQRLKIRDVFAESFNESLRACTYVSAAAVVASLIMYQRHPPDVLKRKKEQGAYDEAKKAAPSLR